MVAVLEATCWVTSDPLLQAGGSHALGTKFKDRTCALGSPRDPPHSIATQSQKRHREKAIHRLGSGFNPVNDSQEQRLLPGWDSQRGSWRKWRTRRPPEAGRQEACPMRARERQGAWQHGPPAAAGAVTGEGGGWRAGHADGWLSGTPRPCARPSRRGSPVPACLAVAFVPWVADCRAPAGADAAAPPGLALAAGGGAAAPGGMRWGTAAGRSASGCFAGKPDGCSEPAEGKRQRRPGRPGRRSVVMVACRPRPSSLSPRTRLGRQRLRCAPGFDSWTHPALNLFHVKASIHVFDFLLGLNRAGENLAPRLISQVNFK